MQKARDYLALYERATFVAKIILDINTPSLSLALLDNYADMARDRVFLAISLDDNVLCNPHFRNEMPVLKVSYATLTSPLGVALLKKDKDSALANVLETCDYEKRIPIMFLIESARFRAKHPAVPSTYNILFAINKYLERIPPYAHCWNHKCARNSAASCDNPVVMYSMCSRCRRVAYCSRECQHADWVRHKPACKHLCEYAKQHNSGAFSASSQPVEK